MLVHLTIQGMFKRTFSKVPVVWNYGKQVNYSDTFTFKNIQFKFKSTILKPYTIKMFEVEMTLEKFSCRH